MSEPLQQLLSVMEKLRNPEGGCPWDIEQNFTTIAPYTLEEAYEVVDAISRKDWRNLEEELGDLLLQVVFHAQMAKEQSLFDFDDVARGIVEKMIRRHPHIFHRQDFEGDTSEINSQGVLNNWETIKKAEKASKGENTKGVLSGIPAGMPALVRAEKLQRKAGKVGFDWNDPKAVIAKLREELDELEAELEVESDKNLNEKQEKKSHEAQQEELGDVLFCVVNLARHLDIDCEMALRSCNQKFENRFNYIETTLNENEKTFQDSTLDEMEALWQEAKKKGL